MFTNTNEEYIVEYAVNTQKAIVLDALRKGETLTPMKAFSRWWITKLATRVSELKRDMEGTGEKIISEMQYEYDAEGKVKRKYAAYHLERC